MGNRDKKLVYHLTALDNLESILEHGLLSRREVRQRGLGFANVADTDILAERALHDLDGMVPFISSRVALLIIAWCTRIPGYSSFSWQCTESLRARMVGR